MTAPVIGVTDFNFITDHLATGGQINDAADLAVIQQAGITHIINCQAERDDEPLLTGTGTQYLWNPTNDDGQPKDPLWFARGVAFAIPALSQPPPTAAVPTAVPTRPRVYAHCAAGVNRGPSMAFMIMLALDWPADLAVAQIQKVRPFVGLAYRQDAISAATILGY